MPLTATTIRTASSKDFSSFLDTIDRTPGMARDMLAIIAGFAPDVLAKAFNIALDIQ